MSAMGMRETAAHARAEVGGMVEATDGAPVYATATWHPLSGVSWLDGHFERSRAVYEAMARAVGLQPGWRVLDAGSGAGSFLPLLADLVGPSGSLTALDLDAANLATAEQRLTAAPVPCPSVASPDQPCIDAPGTP